jgi:hypothetical protein
MISFLNARKYKKRQTVGLPFREAFIDVDRAGSALI